MNQSLETIIKYVEGSFNNTTDKQYFLNRLYDYLVTEGYNNTKIINNKFIETEYNDRIYTLTLQLKNDEIKINIW